MTPKKKAKELVDKFSKLSNYGSYALRLCEYTSKQCAIIVVNEIINSVVITDLTTAETQFKYWEQVKQEIENL